LTPARQQEVLSGVDQSAYSERNSVWARMKSLILIGYYTSEVGANQELHYQLVPGRYDPDVAVKPGDRASSNDWTGQRF
jgi:glucoside 3-dehydrogenase (cytochrome c) hitch-hiker subunit